MRRNNQSVLALISLACIVLLAACDSSTPVLQYVTITPPTGTTSVSGTFQFTAQAYYSNGSIQDGTSLVTWSSSNTSVATIVAGGLATGVGVGTTSITATAAGTAGASATLTVNEPVSVSVSPQTTATGTGQTVSFTANVTNGKSGVTWTASAGTVDVNGNFVAPAGPQSMTVTVTATSKDDTTKSASATVNVVAPGVFADQERAGGPIHDLAGGRRQCQRAVWPRHELWAHHLDATCPSSGVGRSLFVAGMKQSTVTTCAAWSSSPMARNSRTRTRPLPPARCRLTGADHHHDNDWYDAAERCGVVGFASDRRRHRNCVVVTDLDGDVFGGIDPRFTGVVPDPIKLLPNGHFLIGSAGQPDGLNSVVQEVDLGGNIIWQMTAAQLNKALAAATCAGCNITVMGTHHDFAILPNGHLIFIAVDNASRVWGDRYGRRPYRPGPESQSRLGVVELDHLDVARRPFGTGLDAHQFGYVFAGR